LTKSFGWTSRKCRRIIQPLVKKPPHSGNGHDSPAGLTLVPVKEAVAPNKTQEQNTASQVRAAIKRLEFIKSENTLTGERDQDILSKTRKMRDELKQTRLQLVDLPLVDFENVSQQDVNDYFNNPKVNKKYKLKIN
jgi:hypothetical protein